MSTYTKIFTGSDNHLMREFPSVPETGNPSLTSNSLTSGSSSGSKNNSD